jgi:hypothetical protein
MWLAACTQPEQLPRCIACTHAPCKTQREMRRRYTLGIKSGRFENSIEILRKNVNPQTRARWTNATDAAAAIVTATTWRAFQYKIQKQGALPREPCYANIRLLTVMKNTSSAVRDQFRESCIQLTTLDAECRGNRWRAYEHLDFRQRYALSSIAPRMIRVQRTREKVA